MNCDHCLGTGTFLCGSIHAMRLLGASLVRAWRSMLAALAQLG
jgi:hypothetical protein